MPNTQLPVPSTKALCPSDEVFGALEAFYRTFCVHPARRREYGIGHLLYACHIAFPVLINPDIAHKLWLNFRIYYSTEGATQEIHPLAVSDFLLSKLCRETSLAQYELLPGLRPYLLWLLQEDTWWREEGCFAQPNRISFGKQRIDDLASFLQHYVEEHYLPADTANLPFREAQLWTADAWLKPEVAATQILRALQHAEENPLLQDYLSTLGERLEGEYALKVRVGDAKPSAVMVTVFAYSKGLKAYRKGDTVQAVQYFRSILHKGSVGSKEEGQISLMVPDDVAVRLTDNLMQINLPSIAVEQIEENRRTRSTFLDLGNCGLTEIPNEVCDLIWLEGLNLSDEYAAWYKNGTFERKKSNNTGTPNFIQRLPSNIGHLTNLKYLTISGRFNNAWPLNDLTPIAPLVNLESLAVQHTEIDDLSPLKGLIRLKGLAINSTKAADLSPLSSLTNLSRLYAWNTTISDLSPLAGLINLKELNVLSTKISDLSPLSNLINLQELNIRKTNNSDLSSLSNLINLQELDASYTSISDLNPLRNLSRLKNLSCKNTQISSLEPIVNLLNSITEINFTNCPLTHPPKEIVEQGKNAIVAYFEELSKNKIAQIYEANLFIIGDGRVGKTTLSKKFLNPTAPLATDMEVTRGIEIRNIIFNNLKNIDKDLRLNIYDCGGQEIYHDTHTLFYTPNSIYLLVINSEMKNDDNINYWLQTAELYGKESPIFIVENEIGNRRTAFNFSSFAHRFPSLKDRFSINLANNDVNQIEKLRQQIVRMALSLPNIGKSIPRVWEDIRKYLDNIQQDKTYISYEEFQKICKNYGIIEETSQNEISRYLHNSGVFLHFQDNSHLRGTIFLQKQWIMDAIYRVLDDGRIRESNGRFDQKSLTHIWLESSYSGRRYELLQLMLHFEICYPLEDSNSYICPQLLPADSPLSYNLGKGLTIQLKYEYTFIPRGLFNRLIVRLYRFIAQKQTAVWRSGMVLKRQGAYAEIVESARDRAITIQVKGKQAKELTVIVENELERLHESFVKGLKHRCLIPCNCSTCINSEKPHFYDRENLILRESKGRRTVECNVSFEDVSITGLLEGTVTRPLKCFISYSRRDQFYLEEFKMSLAPLVGSGILSYWDDTILRPLEDWDKNIQRALEEADIIFMLISADYLVSYYLIEKEFSVAFARHNPKKLRIFPIILRNCDWKAFLPIKKLNVLAPKGVPISSAASRDAAWREIQKEIERVVDNIRRNDAIIEDENVFNDVPQSLESNVSTIDNNPIREIDDPQNVRTGPSFLNIPRYLTPKPFYPDFFIGRDEDLAAIEADYLQHHHLLVLVNGEGGMGKTTLAAQYWFRHESRYKHLAWVFADSGIGNAILSLANELGVQFQPKDDANTQIARMTAAINNLETPCLLVLDNANNATDLEAYLGVLRRLSNCHILLTSRVTVLHDVSVHRVQPLDRDSATQVFKKHYPKHSDAEDSLLAALLHAVGYNTLVIELLAKNLAVFNKFQTQYSLATLVNDLQERSLLAIQIKPVKTLYQADSLRTATPDLIIAAMYDVSALTDTERFLLHNFAVLPAENIPYAVFIHLLQPDPADAYDDALTSLQQKGWIDFYDDTNAFKISPVIQQIAKSKNATTLLDDCKTLIQTLKDELQRDRIHDDNYKMSTIFTRYAETVVAAFETPQFNAALLCERMGTYYTTVGNLERAMYFYEKCRALSKELCTLQPDNEYNKNILAISYEKLGSTHTSLGNLDKALELYEEDLKLTKELYAAYPNNVDVKNGLAIAYSKLGSTHTALGNLDKALRFYEESNRLGQELYAAYPNNVSFKNGLAISCSKLGSTHTALGNLDKALGFYEERNRLGKELYDAYPNNVEFKNGLAISCEKLGETHTSLGNLDKALELYEERNRLAAALYAAYPNNVSFKNGLAISCSKLGETHTSLGNLDKALGFYEEDLKLTKELYAAYPNNVSFKNGLAVSYYKLGAFSKDNLKDKPQARAYFQQAEDLWQELVRDAPQHVAFQRFLSTVQEILNALD